MSIFALVDCNNFYASCERVFRPELKDKPVITLSSNDGCVIARSNEAKALGIKMGVPFFKVKNLVAQNQVQVFSSNFVLYGDMSARVMHTLMECVPEIEIYSIDEAFLLLDGFPDFMLKARLIKETVKQWTGIPVSIGIGPTKTLAKLANSIAKQYIKTGVYSLLESAVRARVYPKMLIKEIWGVGQRLNKSLNALDVVTIADFVALDPALLRKKFSISLLKTQMELKGESCLSLEDIEAESKSIISSRSFGKSITAFDDLQAAITLHVSKLAHKLRKKNQAIRHFYIYAFNNRFSNTETPRRFSSLIQLPFTTNSTGPLLEAALKNVPVIYEKGVRYKKAGVYAFELFPVGGGVHDLFTPCEDPKQQKLSMLLDEINAKFGKNQIFYGSYGTNRDWLPKDILRSPRYTTEYAEILKVG